jgi:hypothetical protein
MEVKIMKYTNKSVNKNEEKEEQATDNDSFGELLEKLAKQGPIFSDEEDNNR